MKRITQLTFAVIVVLLAACQSQDSIGIKNEVPEDVLINLRQAGFDTELQAPIRFEDGYLVEGDIYLTEAQIEQLTLGDRVPVEEQYSTNNLVATGGSRVINVYISSNGGNSAGNSTANNSFKPGNARGGNGKGGGGGGGDDGGGSADFSDTYGLALDDAIARFNSEPLEITFQRVATSGEADITFSRLGKRDERRGVLGSAGFPTSSGDPYGQILMSGVLESTYGLSVNGIATIMAHEMGHCIGFRHTDYFDRSISCGGSTSNEGDAGIGANHIPGTPTGADLEGNGSWMLACTDGSNRPFTSADQTALDYLY